MIIPVILSGGSGSRLWPLSRELYPKQFISLVNKTSLFQDTIMRLPNELSAPLVICNEEHRFIVAEQLRQINSSNKGIILVAVMHQYDRNNNLTFRGSNANYDTQHLHLFVYGASHYLPVNDVDIDNKVRHIKHCLFRHNKFSKYAKDNKIDIRGVGKGKYLYNDTITPTTFYDYLQLPKLHPSKDCLINYMAGCRENPTAANPLMFIYKEQD